MRALQAAAVCCTTLALLVICCQGHTGRGLSATPKGLDMPMLSNATLLTHLHAVATPRRELVFTTTSAWTPAIVDMLKNFMYHMHAVGRDGNLMVISQDLGTCEKLLVRFCWSNVMHDGTAAAPRRHAPFEAFMICALVNDSV